MDEDMGGMFTVELSTDLLERKGAMKLPLSMVVVSGRKRKTAGVGETCTWRIYIRSTQSHHITARMSGSPKHPSFSISIPCSSRLACMRVNLYICKPCND